MNILVAGNEPVPPARAPGAAPLPGGRRSSCWTTRRGGETVGGEAREGFADLVERITDQRPDESTLAELERLRDGGERRHRAPGQAGTARAAHRGRAAEAAVQALPGRRSSASRPPRRSPSARRATARCRLRTGRRRRQIGTLQSPSNSTATAAPSRADRRRPLRSPVSRSRLTGLGAAEVEVRPLPPHQPVAAALQLVPAPVASKPPSACSTPAS